MKSRSLKFALLSVFVFTAFLFPQKGATPNPDPQRFKKQINAFVQWDKKNSYPQQAVLFVGSSSIRLWPTREAFPRFKVINRGFGGAEISDVLYYINETTLKYQPAVIVFYCGDNDIADKKSAERVLSDFRLFVEKVHKELPATKIVFLPIKPSLARWRLWPEMNKANELVKKYCKQQPYLMYCDTATPMLNKKGKPKEDIFIEDGLHMNDQGYAIWNKTLLPLLELLMNKK